MGKTEMSETTATYLALYPDGHNEKIQLGELMNKGGAAGKIYRDASHPNSVAKIFHEKERKDIFIYTSRRISCALFHIFIIF